VAGSIHHAVGSMADHVAEDCQKLKEDGGRVGLGVGSDGADSQSRGTVESGHGQGPRHAPRLAGAGETGGPTGFVELRWSGGSRMGLLFQPVVWLIFLPVNWLMAKLEQLSGAALQIGKGWERGPWEACAGARYHDSTLLRLRISVEKSLVTPEKVTLYG
jgi:hypothetical protein